MYDIFYVSFGNNDSRFIDLKKRYPRSRLLTDVKSFQDLSRLSFTKMFWVIWDDVCLLETFDLDSYKATKWDDRYIHIFKNGEYLDGICLFPKSSPISSKEFQHRYFREKKEIDIVASKHSPFEKFVIDTYDDYLVACDKSTTEMFWAMWTDIDILEDFDFNYQVPKHNQHITHVFKNGEYYDGLCLMSKNSLVTKKEFQHRYFREKKEIDICASLPEKYNIFEVESYEDYKSALEKSKTDMFWIVPKEVQPLEDFNFDLYFSHHNLYDRNMNHVFRNQFNKDTVNYNGIMLMSKKKVVSKRELDFRFLIEKKEYDQIASKTKLYDIVFISYNEPNADENFDKLIKRFPRAKRIHGIKGIHQAHIKAAELAESEMFWVVDGDAVIVDDFNFDHVVNRYERNIVQVWRSRNPINGLVYGYGGVKLLPRYLTLNMDVHSTDMTTSISDQFRAVDSISNITTFNTDPFNTWKSAFRECVKLSSKLIARQDDDETEKRLEIWCSQGVDEPFGKYAIAGAIAGKDYGMSCKGDQDALSKINDFDWLKNLFDGLQQKH